ncbi:hypothetical protein SO802_009268 [Lithocarpus litseifolius]|uniref:F-box domain-containing protein n=1 Tax=Lithocarpus litseifolius TaxID=425828 RepID=A0AAW2DBJ7_9ROSI
MSQAREPPILRQRNNHLPDDIVLNILARLPIKSVLRFRCVCKPRNTSITSPNFISTHLNVIINNNGYLIHIMPWATRPMNHPQDNIVQLATVTCDRTFTRISQFLQSVSVQTVVHSMASCVSLTGSYIMFLVMREYGVWDQLFAVSLENGKDFLGFTRNGVPLFRTSIAIISFDPETSQVNDLGNRCGPVIAATLMESLVLLDKANILRLNEKRHR